MHPSGLFSVWSIQPQALFLISCCTGHCFACLQSSSLCICLSYQIRSMFLMLLLMNKCRFCFNPLAGCQVSDSQLGLSCQCHRLPCGPQHCKGLPCIPSACLDVLVSTSLLTHNASEVREFVHLLDLLPFDEYTIAMFGIN